MSGSPTTSASPAAAMQLEKPFFKIMPGQDLAQIEAFRRDYMAYRLGHAKGAAGEVSEVMRMRLETNTNLEARMLDLFRVTDCVSDVDTLVNKVSKAFVESKTFSTPNVTEEEIAGRFRRSDMPENPADVLGYFEDLVTDVVNDAIHTSCPQMIGHMTSALPNYTTSLAKLIAAMNQNVVKTETAKTVTFLEREALAQLHKRIYNFTDDFYNEHVQNPATMLGLFTTGGTLANTSALWIARNSRLGPTEDGSFKGVEREGLLKAYRTHGYDDAIVIGSTLMHYSLDKAADLLGIGVNGLVKIPVNDVYQVDLKMMEDKIIEARANKTLVVAIVGICGTTETGAIDSLEAMSELANKYDIHFHVDAAWGGPCIFSQQHRHKAKGIELADSVTLDGHKQLWLPMGAGMVFLKDPFAIHCVRKSANYIIRKDSYDLGKFTIDGSRGAQALYLHANLQLLGLRGYEVLFDRTVRVAKHMARCIARSSNFELIVKPMTNILLYRWLPHSCRDKAFDASLTAEENAFIDECNRVLQSEQKAEGKTFVSRTTINCPKYGHHPIVGLRVVIGNPLTSEEDIDAVFADQHSIIMTKLREHATSDASMPIIERDFGVPLPEKSGQQMLKYWDAVWEQMTPKQKFVYNHDIDAFFDALVTPDCFLDSGSSPRKLG